jgi:hypothetical protein
MLAANLYAGHTEAKYGFEAAAAFLHKKMRYKRYAFRHIRHLGFSPQDGSTVFLQNTGI